MHFHKFPYPANFQFINNASPGKTIKTRLGNYRLDVSANKQDVYKIRISGKDWEQNDSQAGLNFKPIKGMQSANSRLSFDKKTGLRLENNNGETMLESLPIGFFGQNGEASIFQFKREEGTQFYGMGEKWTGFEHSKKITKFWNTDVFADFTKPSYTEGKPASDPVYLSIPYLVIKRGNTYVGLLLDNPHATFIATGLNISIANQMNLPTKESIILLGSERGQPNLYLIYGPSLRELTQKMQQLMGTTPLPPAWSLGYHQCRWGYKSAADLNALDINFRKHKIPVDGLWLDIDFMDNYKVFTLNKQHFPQPKQNLAKLTQAKRRVVPIFDPGVKLQAGYPVYERGEKANAFCLNSQGNHYVGLVWPGESVFPDFSLKNARDWWAGEVAKFARQGITSAWLDMNDPSTGFADNQEMLFDHGRQPHDYYHNQYALGMAMATRQGFLAVRPNERPFLLSRSGFTGSNKYTAIWTGDNCSNYYHLRNGLATSLNLALSGIPFNGGDIGGFAGDTNAPLIRDWYKAGFLLPFFRNHCIKGARQQEPWAFDAKTLSVSRRYIQLRYRLRPYLYQLFAEHELTGEAIIRPLFYDFADTKEQPLGLIADQFMVGSHIMQAPFVDKSLPKRKVLLPGKTHWFSISDGKWLTGGKNINVSASLADTPWYIRDGAILPAARTAPHEHEHRLQKIDFQLFFNRVNQSSINYVFDDGLTFDYQRGKRSGITLTVSRTGSKLAVQWQHTQQGYGKGNFTFTTLGNITEVLINGRKAKIIPAQGIALGKFKTKTWSC
jgi:alpha-glucosidase